MRHASSSQIEDILQTKGATRGGNVLSQIDKVFSFVGQCNSRSFIEAPESLIPKLKGEVLKEYTIYHSTFISGYLSLFAVDSLVYQRTLK